MTTHQPLLPAPEVTGQVSRAFADAADEPRSGAFVRSGGLSVFHSSYLNTLFVM